MELEGKKKVNRGGGSYCCIPQCTSSTGKGIKVFKVPYGKKRFGVSTEKWAKQFHQVNSELCSFNLHLH